MDTVANFGGISGDISGTPKPLDPLFVNSFRSLKVPPSNSSKSSTIGRERPLLKPRQKSLGPTFDQQNEWLRSWAGLEGA